ncbi:MAG: dephospho-CoA kinase [Anaerolineales bacterium]|nr:dephospho-CoA kinase [Anaerolineales bacterium]
MSARNKKTIIGLTGNIATGKTVVRRMLGHLGAYTIDADALTHRIMAPDGPGYQPIIHEFGKFILDQDGSINRQRLGKLVFTDPEALSALEAIIHPYVRKAVDYLIKNAKQNVIVVEAIKLLESPLKDQADVIWVTTSSQDNQLARLSAKRGMSAAESRQRMASQSPPSEKIAAADLVISNDGSFENTWQQVLAGWEQLFPEDAAADPETEQAESIVSQADLSAVKLEEMRTERAKPRQAEDIARFINRHSGRKETLTRMDVMALFGEKAFMLLYAQKQLAGVVGWQVENLVARVNEVYIDETINQPAALRALMKAIEQASKELQAEALLVFVDPVQAADTTLWQPLDYMIHTIEQLEIDAWKEAARESQPPDTLIFFKQLRIDRVLRPI